MAPEPQKILVGVDGSDASIEALRVARTLAGPLGASVEAWACWDVPPGYGLYLAVGAEGFKYAAKEVLEQSLETAFGGERPDYLRGRLVQGRPAPLLIDGTRNASLLIVGRRGHGSFVPGSVSSACVSHAHCPVLVVHGAGNSGGGR
ncbi:nucleotide-binding universal stress UspA family protein [Arthrobacter sp. SLBN-100]|uniref:universal stress protein n=1 Tax=Arthrobacter sp. SLBN-100 TaxID=2768450 RepID=UPI0011531BE0|nr:universal stress protein [Arthrobacter sp. SLBN-100]TQJ66347.1 nucleotide-binding universal stress UspA family protein [Arthrobacter sp. SLBN-100]